MARKKRRKSRYKSREKKRKAEAWKHIHLPECKKKTRRKRKSR